jgi:pimeloyl-ACP methyl ester carboxylesterase
MASAEDMLFAHLDRLPPLKDGQRIERLRHDPKARLGAIGALARTLPGPAPGPQDPSIDPPPGLVGGEVSIGYVPTSAGQVFVRAWGDPAAPAVMYLHDATGTGRSLSPLAPPLARTLRLIAPDLPGSGLSDSPPPSADRLEITTAALAETASALGAENVAVAAQGTSCGLARPLAARVGARAAILHEPLVPGRFSPRALAPRLPLSPDGRHWMRAWMMVRDGEVSLPWCDGRIEAQRRTPGMFEAEFLHEETVALMRSRATYHLTPRLLAAQPDPGPGEGLIRTAGPGRESLFQALAAPPPGASE